MDPYEVLQVDRNAEPDVIRAAYRVLARKNHPDAGGTAERMATLNAAWAILSDPRLRARHDAQAKRQRAAAVSVVRTEAWSPAPSAPPPPPAPTPTAAGQARGTAPGARPAAPQTDPDATRAQEPEPRPAPAPGDASRGMVLDFGRYVGWSMDELSRHDPDYLLWLERTPIGRPLRAEITRALALRQAASAVATATVGRSGSARQSRGWFR